MLFEGKTSKDSERSDFFIIRKIEEPVGFEKFDDLLHRESIVYTAVGTLWGC